MATIGITEFSEKKFSELEFDGEWSDSFGKPESNFKAIIYGDSGNGKTDLSVRLAKYLARFRKVYYNSLEEGFSKSLQMAIVRNNLKEVSGRVIFSDGENFDQMVKRLKQRNSPGAVIIDSAQYMKLTIDQYKELERMFPRKIIIVISWEQNGKPKGSDAQAIEYRSDIKIHVKKFKAYVRSRYGGNKPFVIWDKPDDNAAEKPKKVTKIRMKVAKTSPNIDKKSA